MAARWKARDYAATLVLALIALGLRVLFARAMSLQPAWDGILYERGAQAIARGLGYSTFMFEHRSSDTMPTAFYPVGYPAFVASLYAIFGVHLRVLEWGGALVSSVSVAFAHRMAFRFVPGWPARFGAAAVALMPGQVMFASAAMTEPLFGCLVTVAAYSVVRAKGFMSRSDVAVLVVTLAAATYVRPQAILLAPLLPLLRPSHATGNRWRRLATTAAVTAGVLIAVAPWTARNCENLDGCAFVSTNGGSNLAIGALPRGNGRFFFLDSHDGCAGVVGEVARDRCWRRVAIAAVEAHPLLWIKRAFVKLDHTLSYESFPVGYLREALTQASGVAAARGVFRVVPAPMTDEAERTWRQAITWPWRILLALALLALVPIGSRRTFPDTLIVAMGTSVCVIATHLLFFGGDRYHLPIVPLVGVVAAGAFRGLARLTPRRAQVTLRESRQD